MKIELRHIVAALLILFAWKGNVLDLSWPPAARTEVVAPTPAPELQAWASEVKPIAAGMLPGDRVYLSNLYDAMSFVLMRDKDRDDPIISTTEDFAAFHAGTLTLAIEKAKVGKYPGLDKAIDKAFLSALGTDEPRKMTDEEKGRLIMACGVLSHTFGIGRDG